MVSFDTDSFKSIYYTKKSIDLKNTKIFQQGWN